MKTLKAKFKSRKKFSANSNSRRTTAQKTVGTKTLASHTGGSQPQRKDKLTSTNSQQASSSHNTATNYVNSSGETSGGVIKSNSSTSQSNMKLTSGGGGGGGGSSGNEKAANKLGNALPNKPAELYRLDFITAMKIPDAELLDENNYWVIRDQWKLDWERGVQVPVKTDYMRANALYKPDQFANGGEPPNHEIKLPTKYLCPANDSLLNPQIHQAYLTHGLASSSAALNSTSKICKYDCDSMDLMWLKRANAALELIDQEKLTRANLENLIENFELQSFHNIKVKLDKLNSYSLEFDQDTVCDVCRMPDSEENNEMVISEIN
jgi:protein Jade-1